MKSHVKLLILMAAVLSATGGLYAFDVLSDEGVKCTYTHYDMWKGKMAGEGMLFVGMNGGENEKLYVLWGKNKYDLLQKEVFSMREPDKEKEKSSPPWYQKFTDMLKKAVEWEAAADENGLADVQKQIVLGWTYNKLKKGTPGWISRTWGPPGKYEIIEIKISEIPKLLNLLEGVPELEKKLLDGIKKLKDEADMKKADEKAKKDKVDSVLK